MPMNYRIDHQRRVILSEGYGVLNAKDLCIHYDKIASDKELSMGYRIFCDLRRAERFDLTYETISSVIHAASYSRRSKMIGRVAFLAEKDIGYGVANMYAAMEQLNGQDFMVFRTEAEAWIWLDEVLEAEPGALAPALTTTA